jgi:hypothetical protein
MEMLVELIPVPTPIDNRAGHRGALVVASVNEFQSRIRQKTDGIGFSEDEFLPMARIDRNGYEGDDFASMILECPQTALDPILYGSSPFLVDPVRRINVNGSGVPRILQSVIRWQHVFLSGFRYRVRTGTRIQIYLAKKFPYGVNVFRRRAPILVVGVDFSSGCHNGSD